MGGKNVDLPPLCPFYENTRTKNGLGLGGQVTVIKSNTQQCARGNLHSNLIWDIILRCKMLQ